MVSYRLGLIVSGLLLPSTHLTSVSSIAQAADPIDSVMYRDPAVPTPNVVKTFSDKLKPLWLAALDRPEIEVRNRAALTIAQAHQRGMPGLQSTIPTLLRELERPGAHASIRLAVARALVVLDAKETAPALLKMAETYDNDLREVIEPALARWVYIPAKELWLARTVKPATDSRGLVLAIQGLAALREEQVLPRLREYLFSKDVPPSLRIEAAKAIGTIRVTGGEADASRLISDTTPSGTISRIAAAWLIRRHSGEAVIHHLQALARNPEPAAAAVAIARLLELDPAYVEPVLTVVLSSPDASVRSLGVEVLSRRPSEKHLGLLADRLSDPHPDVRVLARQSLGNLAKEQKHLATIVKEVERLLNGEDWRGKEQAAILLAQLGHKSAADRLVALLKDSRGEVAVASAWALRVLAVPNTYPKALDHFRQTSMMKTAPLWQDHQLTHLAQMFGQARFSPADAALRAVIPPTAPAGFETRAAACWALGLLHEDKPVTDLAAALEGRLAAITPFDMEDDRVRRMCAVALGRMRTKAQLATLRAFAPDPKLSLDPVSNACLWAIERITGEKIPPPGVIEAAQGGWFLTPVGP